ncbi:4254_t:CDS:2 [Cetraspora pellucida]|uniref:4254_t:CDS:1 n=1 Tax=Cetraspora pellucida TaxID=1433469 RepID=A0A9N8WQH2_9GLOM|nr:4254_t:CDS:2 [Cetraspora pellucida]
MLSKHVSVYSHTQEFSEDFVIDSELLMCHFCFHSVNWRIRTNIKTYIKTNGHKTKKNIAATKNQTRQPTLNFILNANESKKNIINNLICAFIKADIPLEKTKNLSVISLIKSHIEQLKNAINIEKSLTTLSQPMFDVFLKLNT